MLAVLGQDAPEADELLAQLVDAPRGAFLALGHEDVHLLLEIPALDVELRQPLRQPVDLPRHPLLGRLLHVNVRLQHVLEAPEVRGLLPLVLRVEVLAQQRCGGFEFRLHLGKHVVPLVVKVENIFAVPGLVEIHHLELWDGHCIRLELRPGGARPAGDPDVATQRRSDGGLEARLPSGADALADAHVDLRVFDLYLHLGGVLGVAEVDLIARSGHVRIEGHL
mmetsp:Transcript_102564/g.313633  ORF Transcript_102564/g.313633 Transcript_102564/m.313633 type:complete len:223 (-) Transcript_102564:1006-1674(-)